MSDDLEDVFEALVGHRKFMICWIHGTPESLKTVAGKYGA